MLPSSYSTTSGHIAYTWSDAACNKSGQVTWSSCPSLSENLMVPLSCLCSSRALQNLDYSCNEGKSSESSPVPANPEQPSSTTSQVLRPLSLSESWESFLRLLQAATSNQSDGPWNNTYLPPEDIAGGSGQQWTQCQIWLREERCW